MTKKSLPIVSSPTLSTVLPISKKKILYRPFVIKEQKALLLAQESKDKDVIFETIKSVIDSCTNGTLDFGSVPTTDIAYFFIQLRIASVGPEVKFGISCSNCGEDNIIGMSLADVSVNTESIITEVKVTDDIGIKFRLPTIDDAIISDSSNNRSVKMLFQLIDMIYDADSVYRKDDYTEEEFTEWIENFNDTQLEQIQKFLNSIPNLSHTVTFECVHCNTKQSRTLEGLQNFFRLGADS